ncbi:g4385 [Coccomyxa elongata]
MATQRKWLRVDDAGELSYVAVGSSNPTAAIFVREKAIVVNLERLRLIISKDQCIILQAPHSPITLGMHVSPEAPFVKDLVLRLRQAKTPWDDKSKLERKQLFADLSLPYELLALESALAAYNKELDTEATDIETLAVPCLERLAARSLNSQASLFRQSTQRRTTGEPPTNDLQEMAADLGTGDDIQTVDALLSRVKVVKERIEATESLITLDLDHRRNRIVEFNLLVTIITMCIAWVGMTAGVFGQNLYFNVAATPLVSDREHSPFRFPVN